MRVDAVAAFAMMTVQRFRYNNYGELSKDSSAVEFPLALDTTFISACRYKLCGETDVQKLAVLFRGLLMPWESFTVSD